MLTWLVVLCCHLVCGGEETKSSYKCYTGEKKKKKEKIRSLNDAWQGYLKTWDQGNSQIFQGHCPWTPQRGLTMPHRTPQLQGPTPWRTSLPYIHPKPCTGNAVESACIIAKFSNSTRTNSFHTLRSRESSS